MLGAHFAVSHLCEITAGITIRPNLSNVHGCIINTSVLGQIKSMLLPYFL